tara:strand:+ start:609 stop:857 length:249 start_codon:yes stop_codon:yes gene_type:complete
MEPLPSTTRFFDYFNEKYGSKYVKPEPKIFTTQDILYMNKTALWKQSIIVPQNKNPNQLYTLENTGQVNRNMDKIYKAIPNN